MADRPTYQMWAYERGGWFQYFGDRRYVEFHGLPYPVVSVRLVEDEDGDYYGWLPAGQALPKMVWRGWACFLVQFPYGPHAMEDTGQGRVLRMCAERDEEPSCA